MARKWVIKKEGCGTGGIKVRDPSANTRNGGINYVTWESFWARWGGAL